MHRVADEKGAVAMLFDEPQGSCMGWSSGRDRRAFSTASRAGIPPLSQKRGLLMVGCAACRNTSRTLGPAAACLGKPNAICQCNRGITGLLKNSRAYLLRESRQPQHTRGQADSA